jgi:hypothetical protein
MAETDRTRDGVRRADGPLQYFLHVTPHRDPRIGAHGAAESILHARNPEEKHFAAETPK